MSHKRSLSELSNHSWGGHNGDEDDGSCPPTKRKVSGMGQVRKDAAHMTRKEEIKLYLEGILINTPRYHEDFKGKKGSSNMPIETTVRMWRFAYTFVKNHDDHMTSTVQVCFNFHSFIHSAPV